MCQSIEVVPSCRETLQPSAVTSALSLLLSRRTQETQTEGHLHPPDPPEAHLHKSPGRHEESADAAPYWRRRALRLFAYPNELSASSKVS